MPDHHTNGEHDGEKLDSNSLASRTRRFFAHVRLFQVRDLMWRLMDAWEEQKRFRLITIGVVLAGVALGATWIWIHPWWSERASIGMARQWMAAGRLDRASDSVRKALAIAPDNPEVWQIASDIARLGGNKAVALSYAHYAAETSQWAPSYLMSWASAAMVADKLDEAEKAMGYMPASYLETSSFARRLAGELARRNRQFTLAQEHFEAAIKLDGPEGLDEVPLGIVLLNSASPENRQRGISLLEKWADQSSLGASAMRALLSDAILRNNTPNMLKWGEALRTHPSCTYGDIPNCLLALSRSDEKKFAQVIAEMEKAHAVNGPQAALLIGWMNQIGRCEEALKWEHVLPPSITNQPTVVVSMAETLRQTRGWGELHRLIQKVDLGENLQFVGWAYGMLAARNLGQVEREQELWNTLKAHSKSNGAHAVFIANTIYSWGWIDEGVTLFKLAAEVPGAEMQALGALLRHYQVQRDAIGQFNIYHQLYGLRAHDAAIGNNFAFYAALTGRDYPNAERISKDNFEHHPDNVTYRATYAFVLAMHGSYAEAHKLLRPVSQKWKQSEALAFAYGFILAKTGSKDEARTVLAKFNSAMVSRQEEDLLVEALR